MTALEYRVGSIIEYVTFLGGTRIVVVTEKDIEIKNGRSGFDGHPRHDPNDLVWGYDDQITRVIEF